MIYKQEAIILRTIEYSDSSQIFTLYTPDFGKVGIMAKGLRRKKNPYQGCMEILNHIEVVYYQKSQGQLGSFRECSIKHHFPQLRNDWARLMTSLYAVELIKRMTIENDANPRLFHLLRYCLQKLGSGGNPKNLLFYIQWHTLQLLGYSLPITSCYRCGRMFDMPNLNLLFFPQDANMYCAFCRPLGKKYLISCNSNAVLKLQDLLQNSKSGALDTVQFEPLESKQLYAVMSSYIHGIIDGELNLHPYFKDSIV